MPNAGVIVGLMGSLAELEAAVELELAETEGALVGEMVRETFVGSVVGDGEEVMEEKEDWTVDPSDVMVDEAEAEGAVVGEASPEDCELVAAGSATDELPGSVVVTSRTFIWLLGRRRARTLSTQQTRRRIDANAFRTRILHPALSVLKLTKMQGRGRAVLQQLAVSALTSEGKHESERK
jgi:hypothetical protein